MPKRFHVETAREFLARRHRERLEITRHVIAHELDAMPPHIIPATQTRHYPPGHGRTT